MPIYTFICETCATVEEHLVCYDGRATPVTCQCGGQMKRRGLETFSLGKPAHQTGIILGDGTRVDGQFGKDAKRRRKKKS